MCSKNFISFFSFGVIQSLILRIPTHSLLNKVISSRMQCTFTAVRTLFLLYRSLITRDGKAAGTKDLPHMALGF